VISLILPYLVQKSRHGKDPFVRGKWHFRTGGGEGHGHTHDHMAKEMDGLMFPCGAQNCKCHAVSLHYAHMGLAEGHDG
jgi:hypothetical protein